MATFGNTNVGANETGLSLNYKRGYRFQCPENGTTESMSWYGRVLSGSAHIRLGIYSDNNGAPDALLGYTEEITVTTTAQWYTANFVSPVQLQANTWYWLCFICEAAVRFRYDTGETNYGAYNTDTYSDGFSNPFGTPNYSTYKVSIYCIYTPTGGAQKTWSAVLNVSHVCTRPLRSFKLSQGLNASHAFIRNRFMKLTQALQMLHAWAVMAPIILKQWFAVVQAAHTFSRPVRVVRIPATLRLTHVFNRPYRFMRLFQKLSLGHAYFVVVPGVKKTKLFLVIGDLAIQLS